MKERTSTQFRVLKFGGSSVADATAMSGVLDIVEKEEKKGKIILVCSAISGCTDALLGGDPAALEEIAARHSDIIKRLFTGTLREEVLQKIRQLLSLIELAPKEEKVTFGELLSTRILEEKLKAEGYRVLWMDSRRLVVKDNQKQTYDRISKAIEEAPDYDIYVAPGFICEGPDGRPSTLGRGGSDYSAALYAAAVKACSLQIWTDVPGIMTCNPKQVPAARTIPELSYQSALDMASNGAKVLYAPTVAPAMEAGIDIEIKNTFAPKGPYSVIGKGKDKEGWIGIASKEDTIRIVGAGASTEDGLRIAASALRRAGIAAISLTSEEGGISLKLKPAILGKALLALHKAFFQVLPSRTVHLFLAGNGAVATALTDMIHSTRENVFKRTGKVLKISGRSNSKSFGIDLENEPLICREGNFAEEIIKCAPAGSVFIDATDSHSIYKSYVPLMEAGINIVSSNRRSLAVPYEEYALMRSAARENGVFLRYETTVGAALPILGSIAQGANSMDEVVSIEAVVSCTMNQILGAYIPGNKTFASMLMKARREGLTEKDPRKDIGGKDALRKLLILSREAGVELEEKDVLVEPVVPAELLEGSLEQFYKGLQDMEPVFTKMYVDAALEGYRLRFVATLEKARGRYKASIGIKKVAGEHPAYYLKGTENSIMVKSAYHPYPLVIQGPGEGAREAASSIMSDILR